MLTVKNYPKHPSLVSSNTTSVFSAVSWTHRVHKCFIHSGEHFQTQMNNSSVRKYDYAVYKSKLLKFFFPPQLLKHISRKFHPYSQKLKHKCNLNVIEHFYILCMHLAVFFFFLHIFVSYNVKIKMCYIC